MLLRWVSGGIGTSDSEGRCFEHTKKGHWNMNIGHLIVGGKRTLLIDDALTPTHYMGGGLSFGNGPKMGHFEVMKPPKMGGFEGPK